MICDVINDNVAFFVLVVKIIIVLFENLVCKPLYSKKDTGDASTNIDYVSEVNKAIIVASWMVILRMC